MKPDPRRPIPFYFSLGFSLLFTWIHPVSPVFSFTRVAASSEDLTIVSKGGAFSPSSSSLSSLSLYLSVASWSAWSLFFSHPLNQHYLIIDRMILLSARMARPAEHTFHFVNVRP